MSLLIEILCVIYEDITVDAVLMFMIRPTDNCIEYAMFVATALPRSIKSSPIENCSYCRP